MIELTAIIEQDEDGMFCATIKELKGCHTQAKTREELEVRLIDAIHMFIEDEEDVTLSYFDAKWV